MASHIPPTPPTGLLARTSPTRIDLSWRASAGPRPIVYRVIYRKATSSYWLLGPITTLLSDTITGLSPSTKYSIIVEATDSMGTSVSAILDVTTPAAGVPPGPAANLTISSVTATSLIVSWSAPSSGTQPFSYQLQIEPSGSPSFANYGLQTTQTSEQVTGLSSLTTYSFLVVTSNQTGNSTSSTVSTTTLAILPSAPTGLLVNGPVSQTTVPLSWSASTGTAPVSYQVFSRTPSGSGTFIAGQTTNALSIVVTGLQPATSYDFEIIASNAGGTGPASNILSNVVTVGSPLAPSTPTGLSAGTIQPTSMQISWQGSATGTPPITYVLQYRPTPSSVVAPGAPTGLSGGSPSSTSVQLSWTAPSVGSLPLTYNVLQSTHGTNTFVQIGTASTANFAVTGLSPSTSYDFEVTVTNTAGTGPISNIATVTTASAGAVPGVPASITTSALTATSVTVTWSPPTTGGVVGGYSVLYKVSTASGYTDFIDIPVCTPGVGSLFVGGNTWAISTSGKITINGNPDPPTANVLYLTFINGLFWQQNSAGSWYSEATNNDSWALQSTTPWMVAVTGLTSSTTYNFEVRAFNSIGTGSATAPATATTMTSITTSFSDSFATFSVHQNWQAGDKWAFASPSTPQGRGGPNDGEVGDQWWTNPLNPSTPITGLVQLAPGGGGLQIGLKPTPSANSAYITAQAGASLPYVAILLNTEPSFQQLLGFWEITCSVPNLPGFSFAVSLESWDKPTGGTWPPEMDFGIYTDSGGTQRLFVQVNVSSGTSPSQLTAFNATAPNAYGIDWGTNAITFYVNRQQVFQTATPTGNNYTTSSAYIYLYTGANYPFGAGAQAGVDPAVGSLPVYALVQSVNVWPSRPF